MSSPSPAPTLILARFGELGIKGKATRRWFVRKLKENLENALVARGVEAQVEDDGGRFFIYAHDAEGALQAITHTFGFVSASPAHEVKADVTSVSEAAARLAAGRILPGASFAVRARRTGTHPFSSMEIAGAAGHAILAAIPGSRVDLSKPDVEVSIEIRNSRAFLFTEWRAGPGGLPHATQGKVLAHIASPRDAAAAWLVLRRGCSLEAIVPAALPDSTKRALAALQSFVPKLRIEEDAAPRLVALQVRERRRGAVAGVVGDGIRDIARGAITFDAGLHVPVLRPLVGYPTGELPALAKRCEMPDLLDDAFDPDPDADGDADPARPRGMAA
ncbi:MAG: THUMP domain-containing protein [Thermoplasmatota archaeon]